MSSTNAVRPPAHFEPHIQGLRAIAVALVVLYHVWPDRLTGGYVGVDVFFVISGYLITGQLLRELDGGGTSGFQRIRLGTFWAKRIRRLLPAALLVLVVCSILTLTLMPLSALWETFKEIIGSTLYAQNWVLVANSADYLGNSDDSLVVHYWSLSVEEQFYLVWPLLLLLVAWIAYRVWRRRHVAADGSFGGGSDLHIARRRAIVIAILVVAVASYVLCGLWTTVDSSSAYFATPTRMWEFGIGGLLAALPALRPRARWLNAVVGWVGVLLVLGAGWFFTEQTVFPGWLAAVPTVGALLAIAAARADSWWLPARWLAVRPARWVGDISYSLYLWHWPLIIVAPYIPHWPLEWWNRVVLIVVSVLLAWATKRLVEDPFRSWRWLTSGRLWLTFAAGAAMMAVSIAAISGVTSTLNLQYVSDIQQLQQTVAHPPACFGAASAISPCSNPALAGTIIPSPGFAKADGPVHNECFSQLQDSSVRACHFGSDAPDALRVALVGDSHAFQYSDTLISMADANGWSLTLYLKGACPWSALQIDEVDAFGTACDAFQRNEAAALAAAPRFDAVVTTAFIETEYASDGHKADAATAAKGYQDAWAALGAPVVAIEDNPRFTDDPNKCLKSTGAAADCTRPRDEALNAQDPVAMAATASGAQLIDLSDTYCSATVCNSVVNGAALYRDRDHLTDTWISTMAPILKTAILRAAASR